MIESREKDKEMYNYPIISVFIESRKQPLPNFQSFDSCNQKESCNIASLQGMVGVCVFQWGAFIVLRDALQWVAGQQDVSERDLMWRYLLKSHLWTQVVDHRIEGSGFSDMNINNLFSCHGIYHRLEFTVVSHD